MFFRRAADCGAMEELDRQSFQRAIDSIYEHGRTLEEASVQHLFRETDPEIVIGELKSYQNEDGGFGNALEPDFRLPSSSPLATSIAFQILEELEMNSSWSEMIEPAVQYLEDSYDEQRGGWLTVPESVNDFPHAPWWHFDDEKGGTIIDNHWGNPTAELTGYLYRHQNMVSEIDVEALIDRAVDHINSLLEFESPAEVYCYVRLYHLLPSEKSGEMEDQITKGVQGLVEEDPDEWSKYVPQPLHFIKNRDSPRFGIPEESIERNLDYMASRLNSSGMLKPNWEWGRYQDTWEIAREEWIGILTLRALVTLKDFNRIKDL